MIRLNFFAVGVAMLAIGCVDDNLEYGTDIGALQAQGELPEPNSYGIAESVSDLGPIDLSNPFFSTEFASNGRSCVPCHDPAAGWTTSGDLSRELFRESDGLDPLFRIHDTGTRPDAPIDTESQRRRAFKPTIRRGLVRFPQSVSPDAEFEVIAVDDPYGFGTPALYTKFRRPTPTANEKLVASILWTNGPQADIPALLAGLFTAATTFHGQGTVPPPEANEAAGLFMRSIFHAQAEDRIAGRLDVGGARGGPVYLSQQEFFEGINSGEDFDPKVFDIFDAWLDEDNCRHGGVTRRQARRRASIARGQEIFNFKEFPNGGTCSGCHNAPNVGTSSVFRMRNIGTSEPTPRVRRYLPVLTLRNKTTGEVIEVTDIGRAEATGLWDDIGRFRTPPLRGLASRAPYFHDGRARTIAEVIKHYEDRFDIDFTHRERKDLEAFLSAL